MHFRFLDEEGRNCWSHSASMKRVKPNPCVELLRILSRTVTFSAALMKIDPRVSAVLDIVVVCDFEC